MLGLAQAAHLACWFSPAPCQQLEAADSALVCRRSILQANPNTRDDGWSVDWRRSRRRVGISARGTGESYQGQSQPQIINHATNRQRDAEGAHGLPLWRLPLHIQTCPTAGFCSWSIACWPAGTKQAHTASRKPTTTGLLLRPRHRRRRPCAPGRGQAAQCPGRP